MRNNHGDVIVAAQLTRPTPKGPSKKKKVTVRANSVDSLDYVEDATLPALGAAGVGREGGGGDGENEEDAQWTEEELELFERFPGMGKWFVVYVVAKAKYAWLMGDHEGCLSELEALGIRESELGAECEELLRMILRKEVGSVFLVLSSSSLNLC
jgi:hypothetical protein